MRRPPSIPENLLRDIVAALAIAWAALELLARL